MRTWHPGVAAAALFRSQAPLHAQAPPFEQLIVQLFSQANPVQQADLANRLLGGMPASAWGAMPADPGAFGGPFGGLLLQRASQLAGPMAITPEQASHLTPDEVKQLAAHASAHSAGLVERLSGFYAEHPGLMTTVSRAALTLAWATLAERDAT